MALWMLHVDAAGLVCAVTPAAKDASFFRAMRAIPHVTLADEDIAWPNGERWASPHMTAADWQALGVNPLERSDA